MQRGTWPWGWRGTAWIRDRTWVLDEVEILVVRMTKDVERVQDMKKSREKRGHNQEEEPQNARLNTRDTSGD